MNHTTGRLLCIWLFLLSCVHTHALLKCLPGGLSAAAAAAAAAADGAGVVIFNDGEAEPGEAASSPAAVLPTQRSNVTLVLAGKEATRHIGVAAAAESRRRQ